MDFQVLHNKSKYYDHKFKKDLFYKNHFCNLK